MLSNDHQGYIIIFLFLQVLMFVQQLANLLPDYEIACEHEHSNCVLLAHNKVINYLITSQKICAKQVHIFQNFMGYLTNFCCYAQLHILHLVFY